MTVSAVIDGDSKLILGVRLEAENLRQIRLKLSAFYFSTLFGSCSYLKVLLLTHFGAFDLGKLLLLRDRSIRSELIKTNNNMRCDGKLQKQLVSQVKEWSRCQHHVLSLRSQCWQTAVSGCRAVVGSAVVHMTGPEEANSHVFSEVLYFFSLEMFYFLWEYYHTCISPENIIESAWGEPWPPSLQGLLSSLLHPLLISPHHLRCVQLSLLFIVLLLLLLLEHSLPLLFACTLKKTQQFLFNWELSWKTLWRFCLFVLFFTCK